MAAAVAVVDTAVVVVATSIAGLSSRLQPAHTGRQQNEGTKGSGAGAHAGTVPLPRRPAGALGAEGGLMVRLYAELAKRSFRRWSTYRAATVAGIFTNSVFGFIRASVLLAVLEARPGAGGLDATGVITYSFLTQSLLAAADVFGGDQEIATRVRTGDIVGDLYRPVDFQAWWLAADWAGPRSRSSPAACRSSSSAR